MGGLQGRLVDGEGALEEGAGGGVLAEIHAGDPVEAERDVLRELRELREAAFFVGQAELHRQAVPALDPRADVTEGFGQAAALQDGPSKHLDLDGVARCPGDPGVPRQKRSAESLGESHIRGIVGGEVVAQGPDSRQKGLVAVTLDGKIP